MIQVLDTVVVKHDVPKHGLKIGAVGTHARRYDEVAFPSTRERESFDQLLSF